MGKTSATWADIGAFLKADRWTPGRKTDHQFFTKLLPDGTTLETSISNSGRKTLTPGRFSDILRTQLRVSRDDFWEAIRAGNPAARPSVVEVPPPQHLSWVVRVLSNELHMSAEEIGAGDRISLMWIAANRDPAIFADADRVDLDRHVADNLLFGAGIHRCLGEPLARLNLRVGVNELLRHTGRFEFAGSEAPTRHVYPSNGLGSLRLRLTPTNGSER